MAGNRPARERFDFSLDSRQVAGITLGSLGALALAFLLGLWLGQRVPDRPAAIVPRAEPVPAAPAKGLDAIDQALRPDGGEPAGGDTFHDKLTRPSPPPDQLPPVPKGQAAAPVPSPAKPAAPASLPVAAAASTTAAAAPAGPSGASGPAADAPPKGAPPPPSAKPVPPKAPAPTARPAAPPAKAVPPAAPKAPAGKGAFTVQVGSTQDRFEAERIATRFASRGARVTSADVPGKGRWYRVRIGAFETKDDAARYLRDLEKSTGTKGFVAPAN